MPEPKSNKPKLTYTLSSTPHVVSVAGIRASTEEFSPTASSRHASRREVNFSSTVGFSPPLTSYIYATASDLDSLYTLAGLSPVRSELVYIENPCATSEFANYRLECRRCGVFSSDGSAAGHASSDGEPPDPTTRRSE